KEGSLGIKSTGAGSGSRAVRRSGNTCSRRSIAISLRRNSLHHLPVASEQGACDGAHTTDGHEWRRVCPAPCHTDPSERPHMSQRNLSILALGLTVACLDVPTTGP